MADEMEPKAETSAESQAPGAEAAEGQQKPANGGGLQEFLFQFLKANPDIAREMSTRMNAVINGQRLGMMKSQPQGGAPSAPPAQPPTKMAGDVIPLAGDRSMGPGETSQAVPYALGQQTAPNVVPIGNGTLQQWLTNVRARQG